MDKKELIALSELFWEGETSEEQELLLKEALRYGECPEECLDLRDYFNFNDEQREELSLDADFGENVMRQIESSNRVGYKRKRFWAIAASIALLLGATMFWKAGEEEISSQDSYAEFEDTYEDPEQAYEEAKKALMLVSMKMNQGLSYTGSLESLDQAKGRINKK